MAIPNPSFETGLPLGAYTPERTVVDVPDEWSRDISGHEWAAATFDAELMHAEGFEMLWGAAPPYNDERLLSFSPGDLAAASFGVAPLAVTAYEGFETQWNGNQFRADEFDGSMITEATGSPDDFTDGWYQRHLIDDTAFATTVVPLSLPSVIVRLNLLKTTFNTHRTATGRHVANDTTNVVSSADASDQGTSETLAAELWTKVWAHVLDAALDYHRADFAFGIDDAPWVDIDSTPTGLAAVVAVANALTVVFASHQEWASVDGVSFGTSLYAPDDPPHVSLILETRAPVFGKETFESSWSNTPRITEFTSELSAAGFETDAADDAYEGFERSLTMDFPAGNGIGAAIDIDPTGRVRVAVTIDAAPAWNASVAIQTLDDGSVTWVTRQTIDAGASGVYNYDPDEGFKSIRLVVSNYVAGAGTAALKWQPLPAGSL